MFFVIEEWEKGSDTEIYGKVMIIWRNLALKGGGVQTAPKTFPTSHIWHDVMRENKGIGIGLGYIAVW